MKSYYYLGGIKNNGGNNNNNSTVDDSNYDELVKTIQSLELQLATLQAKISQLLGLNNKITALTGRVEELELNEVNIKQDEDTSPLFRNVYNTKYINDNFKNLHMHIVDDIHAQIVDQYPYVPSIQAIQAIQNIDFIPSVYNYSIESNDDTYSTTYLNNLLNHIPTILDSSGKPITTSNPIAYGKDYIDMMIPIIYHVKDTNPSDNNVYDTAYVNSIENKLPKIYDDKITDTSGSSNVYSCYYINNMAIPYSILFNTDTHESGASDSDTSINNVYDTYYVDQWFSSTIETIGLEQKQSNELRLKLFNEGDRTTQISGANVYRQTYGNNLQEMILKPMDNKLVILSQNTQDDEGIKLVSVHRPSALSSVENVNNGTLSIRTINIGDGSNSLYENHSVGSSDIRYSPAMSVLEQIDTSQSPSSTTFDNKILFGLTEGKVGEGVITGDIESESNFSIFKYHVDTSDSSNNHLSIGLNNPIPNLNSVNHENIINVHSNNVEITETLTVAGNVELNNNLSVNGNTMLGNESTDTLSVSGPATLSNNLSVNGNTTLGNESTDTLYVSGPTTLNNTLYVSGTTQLNDDLTVNGIITQTSDMRLKQNVKKIESGNTIYQLNPVSFTMKDKLRFGFIAQEVQKILPEIVYKAENSDYLTVNYTEIIPFLVKAIQKQKEQIDSMNSEIQEQKKLIDSMNSEIQLLKEQLSYVME